MLVTALLIGAMIVAFGNGIDSVFKSVATIYGSGIADYRVALGWATLTTFSGSVASIFLRSAVLTNFSSQGLVNDELVSAPSFLASISVGTGLTVLAATFLGALVPTTLALMRALLGAGCMAVGPAVVNFAKLRTDFIAPLLFSPIIAVGLAALVWILIRLSRAPVGSEIDASWTVIATYLTSIGFSKGRAMPRIPDRPLSSPGVHVLHSAPFLSSGIVSFARGLNDTPKMAALLLLVPWLTPASDIVLVALPTAIASVFAARRVAKTMSLKITSIDHSQGLVANITTSAVVVAASPLGLPIATRHVAACSLFGIGLVTGQSNTRIVFGITGAWLVTLTFSGAVASVTYYALSKLVG